MSHGLPETVQPWRLTDRGALIEGETSIRGLPRLAASLVDDDGAVQARLRFSTDEHGDRLVDVAVQARVRVTCQRCLEPLEMDIRADSTLLLIEEDAASPPERSAHEPYLVRGDELRPRDLIEDELLLALPFAPMHPDSVCSLATDPGEVGNPQHPFAMLAKLKGP